jgi:hypothetical protein
MSAKSQGQAVGGKHEGFPAAHQCTPHQCTWVSALTMVSVLTNTHLQGAKQTTPPLPILVGN